MFRTAIRPVTVAARSLKPATPVRTLAVSAVRRSSAPAPPLFPPGAKDGEVPTDELHATGLERLQLLGEKEGVKVFDYDALDSSRIGTLADPIKVFSWVCTCSYSLPARASRECCSLIAICGMFNRSLNVLLAVPEALLSRMSSSG